MVIQIDRLTNLEFSRVNVFLFHVFCLIILPRMGFVGSVRVGQSAGGWFRRSAARQTRGEAADGRSVHFIPRIGNAQPARKRHRRISRPRPSHPRPVPRHTGIRLSARIPVSGSKRPATPSGKWRGEASVNSLYGVHAVPGSEQPTRERRVDNGR